MPATERFFDEQAEHSRVKSEIVVSYFATWAAIMAPHASRLGYVDLYAGPGRYDDGTESTALLILRKAIADPKIGRRLISVFNDANPSYVHSLRAAIRSRSGVETLAFQPDVGTAAVDTEYRAEFERVSGYPALTFIDPWGYKGLTKNLIGAVVQRFGSRSVAFTPPRWRRPPRVRGSQSR